jgi:hypothetical protein
MSQAARVQALSIGHALDADSAGFGIVHSVFARAVNLMVREEMWTLLAAEKADLPFGIRVASSDLGRGPGSTPCGDDVLVGILAVLNSPHSGAAGARAA